MKLCWSGQKGWSGLRIWLHILKQVNILHFNNKRNEHRINVSCGSFFGSYDISRWSPLILILKMPYFKRRKMAKTEDRLQLILIYMKSTHGTRYILMGWKKWSNCQLYRCNGSRYNWQMWIRYCLFPDDEYIFF